MAGGRGTTMQMTEAQLLANMANAREIPDAAL
jgi:hypothetical protein